MPTTFYPMVNPSVIAALITIRQQMENDPTYLDQDQCPYDNDLKEDLRKILSPKVVEVPVEKIVEVERVIERAVEGGGKRGPKMKLGDANVADVVDKEIADTLNDLRTLKTGSKTLQPADKLAIMKTQAMLLEKLVTTQERKVNIKKMAQFMSTVMGILDDLMPEDMRQTFMKRLQPFADQE